MSKGPPVAWRTGACTYSSQAQAGYLSAKASNCSMCAQWGFLSLCALFKAAGYKMTVSICFHLLISLQKARALLQQPAQRLSSIFTSIPTWEMEKTLGLTAWSDLAWESFWYWCTNLNSLHFSIAQLEWEHSGECKIHGWFAAVRNHGFWRAMERMNKKNTPMKVLACMHMLKINLTLPIFNG